MNIIYYKKLGLIWFMNPFNGVFNIYLHLGALTT